MKGVLLVLINAHILKLMNSSCLRGKTELQKEKTSVCVLLRWGHHAATSASVLVIKSPLYSLQQQFSVSSHPFTIYTPSSSTFSLLFTQALAQPPPPHPSPPALSIKARVV